MSLLKRKTYSLDPSEKMKKNRQIEYFMLIDKCLQIPNDDKLIIRKNVESEDECLLSLLEKYRKQGSKDLKQLQIYLRKFIQRYKSQNPKYPTLKIGRGSQSCLSFNKRSSFSFSVSTSKISSNLMNSNASKLKNTRQNLQSFLGNSRHQMSFSKSKLSTPFKPERQNHFGIVTKSFQKNNVKDALKFNGSYSRQVEKNYQDLIKKRKTQKLKIEANRVSVTIENQLFSPLNNTLSKQKAHEKDNLKSRTEYSLVNESFMNVNDSFQMPIQSVKVSNTEMKEAKNQIDLLNLRDQESRILKPNQNKIQEGTQKEGFLSTMSFKMKIDEAQEIQCDPQKIIQSRNSSVKSNLLQSEKVNIMIISQKTQKVTQSNQLKRKLFDSYSSTHQDTVFDQIQEQTKNRQQQKYPLQEIKHQNKDLTYVNLQQKTNYKTKQHLKESKRGKENFNSGQKFLNNQSNLKQILNHSLLQSQVKSTNQNISQLSSISKSNFQNYEMSNYYLPSQRSPNQITSQRFLEDSKAFIKSSIRERDQKSLKESKSSRMQFSHRMEEIISGRTQKNQTSTGASISNRDKIQGANKLAFWARIQSTINE